MNGLPPVKIDKGIQRIEVERGLADVYLPVPSEGAGERPLECLLTNGETECEQERPRETSEGS